MKTNHSVFKYKEIFGNVHLRKRAYMSNKFKMHCISHSNPIDYNKTINIYLQYKRIGGIRIRNTLTYHNHNVLNTLLRVYDESKHVVLISP